MFNKIDFENWDRLEIFKVLRDCKYTICVDIDVTLMVAKLAHLDKKFYPAINFCLLNVVNKNECFRYAIKDGAVGFFDRVDTLYTVIRTKSQLFTHKLTKYEPDFEVFYCNFMRDKQLCEACDRLYYDSDMDSNKMCVSVTPKLSFKALSFNYNVTDENNFIPFATVGRYFHQGERILLPVSVEFSHETNDGMHAELFFAQLQQECDNL